MTAEANRNSLQATGPGLNATVHASAGTGKTWLLVTRIIRLLLAGASPDSIMAVTFTRKAAAEMQERVSLRLYELMRAPSTEMHDLLAQCGISPAPEVAEQVRRLYEQNLFNHYPLRATTFHAFCQELLQRFPLEAGIPPAFELTETTALHEQAAWDALFASATRKPDSPIACALDQLIDRCNGIANTRAALLSFLSHRSDWWAYTKGQTDPVRHAVKSLAGVLQVRLSDDPLQQFPTVVQREQLQAFAALLGQNGTTTDLRYKRNLEAALAPGLSPADVFAGIKPVFLTQKNECRKRKSSAALRRRLGEAGEADYLRLHESLVSQLLEMLDHLARLNTLHTSSAWYTAGAALLEHYQRIKLEQRLLDFADLEWQACELLNRSDHASWIQYKLDKRIDHLLVDEFQDTNPTQWRLLLPLLEELAASGRERERSVFLVGDEKQSIYRFRRANPALLQTASSWLADRLAAHPFTLDKSRRSAQAIIDSVNAVFDSGLLHERISRFTAHATHHPALYGRFEVLPLATSPPPPDDETSSGLRNPLLQPRLVDEDQRHYQEGRCIAARIQSLIDSGTLLDTSDTARRMTYGDVMILFRQRTHATAYERALRDCGIPYLGAGRGTLLEAVEVRDMEALLNILIAPYDNLALAQVLRSPLFGLTDNDLMVLAALPGGTWYERLEVLEAGVHQHLSAAARMLAGWHELAGQIPVHDLLDRIYHEGEVLRRYDAAFPAALKPRARANLTRFIELALEIDSGRYPSLPRFLNQLERLRRFEQDQPDEASPEQADSNRVRLMTIHAAKGLEAPVVFLADTAKGETKSRAFETLVEWPADADRPRHYLLVGSKADQDGVTTRLLQQQTEEDLREDANLLYVAMTRARQFLFISGSAPNRGSDTGWYGMITAALAPDGAEAESAAHVHETGTLPAKARTAPAAVATVTPAPGLSRPVRLIPVIEQIAPSHTVQRHADQNGDPDGLERGIAIHLMLERLSQYHDDAPASLLDTLSGQLGRDPADPELRAWWDEALGVYHSPAQASLFDTARFRKAWNEVPVQYLSGERMVYGIIDRLVVREETVVVIDYKTHRHATPANCSELARHYSAQIAHYSRAAALLWPRQRIQACLLFTACNERVEM